MSEYVEVPRQLIETLAKDGDKLAQIVLQDEVEVLAVHPASVIRVHDGIVQVATSEARAKAPTSQ